MYFQHTEATAYAPSADELSRDTDDSNTNTFLPYVAEATGVSVNLSEQPGDNNTHVGERERSNNKAPYGRQIRSTSYSARTVNLDHYLAMVGKTDLDEKAKATLKMLQTAGTLLPTIASALILDHERFHLTINYLSLTQLDGGTPPPRSLERYLLTELFDFDPVAMPAASNPHQQARLNWSTGQTNNTGSEQAFNEKTTAFNNKTTAQLTEGYARTAAPDAVASDTPLRLQSCAVELPLIVFAIRPDLLKQELSHAKVSLNLLEKVKKLLDEITFSVNTKRAITPEQAKLIRGIVELLRSYETSLGVTPATEELTLPNLTTRTAAVLGKMKGNIRQLEKHLANLLENAATLFVQALLKKASSPADLTASFDTLVQLSDNMIENRIGCNILQEIISDITQLGSRSKFSLEDFNTEIERLKAKISLIPDTSRDPLAHLIAIVESLLEKLEAIHTGARQFQAALTTHDEAGTFNPSDFFIHMLTPLAQFNSVAAANLSWQSALTILLTSIKKHGFSDLNEQETANLHRAVELITAAIPTINDENYPALLQQLSPFISSDWLLQMIPMTEAIRDEVKNRPNSAYKELTLFLSELYVATIDKSQLSPERAIQHIRHTANAFRDTPADSDAARKKIAGQLAQKFKLKGKENTSRPISEAICLYIDPTHTVNKSQQSLPSGRVEPPENVALSDALSWVRLIREICKNHFTLMLNNNATHTARLYAFDRWGEAFTQTTGAQWSLSKLHEATREKFIQLFSRPPTSASALRSAITELCLEMLNGLSEDAPNRQIILEVVGLLASTGTKNIQLSPAILPPANGNSSTRTHSNEAKNHPLLIAIDCFMQINHRTPLNLGRIAELTSLISRGFNFNDKFTLQLFELAVRFHSKALLAVVMDIFDKKSDLELRRQISPADTLLSLRIPAPMAPLANRINSMRINPSAGALDTAQLCRLLNSMVQKGFLTLSQAQAGALVAQFQELGLDDFANIALQYLGFAPRFTDVATWRAQFDRATDYACQHYEDVTPIANTLIPLRKQLAETALISRANTGNSLPEALRDTYSPAKLIAKMLIQHYKLFDQTPAHQKAIESFIERHFNSFLSPNQAGLIRYLRNRTEKSRYDILQENKTAEAITAKLLDRNPRSQIPPKLPTPVTAEHKALFREILTQFVQLHLQYFFYHWNENAILAALKATVGQIVHTLNSTAATNPKQLIEEPLNQLSRTLAENNNVAPEGPVEDNALSRSLVRLDNVWRTKAWRTKQAAWENYRTEVDPLLALQMLYRIYVNYPEGDMASVIERAIQKQLAFKAMKLSPAQAEFARVAMPGMREPLLDLTKQAFSQSANITVFNRNQKGATPNPLFHCHLVGDHKKLSLLKNALLQHHLGLTNLAEITKQLSTTAPSFPFKNSQHNNGYVLLLTLSLEEASDVIYAQFYVTPTKEGKCRCFPIYYHNKHAPEDHSGNIKGLLSKFTNDYQKLRLACFLITQYKKAFGADSSEHPNYANCTQAIYHLVHRQLAADSNTANALITQLENNHFISLINALKHEPSDTLFDAIKSLALTGEEDPFQQCKAMLAVREYCLVEGEIDAANIMQDALLEKGINPALSPTSTQIAAVLLQQNGTAEADANTLIRSRDLLATVAARIKTESRENRVANVALLYSLLAEHYFPDLDTTVDLSLSKEDRLLHRLVMLYQRIANEANQTDSHKHMKQRLQIEVSNTYGIILGSQAMSEAVISSYIPEQNQTTRTEMQRKTQWGIPPGYLENTIGSYLHLCQQLEPLKVELQNNPTAQQHLQHFFRSFSDTNTGEHRALCHWLIPYATSQAGALEIYLKQHMMQHFKFTEQEVKKEIKDYQATHAQHSTDASATRGPIHPSRRTTPGGCQVYGTSALHPKQQARQPERGSTLVSASKQP
jgi:hypothetical protein